MSRLARLVLVSLLVVLPLHVGAKTGVSSDVVAKPADGRGPAAPGTLQWYDGLPQYSEISDCILLTQEWGAGAWVGFQADPDASIPAPNSTYYVHVVVSGLGDSCSGMRAYIDIKLPANTTLAIDATNKVYCYYDNVQDQGDCPQSLPPSVFNPGAYAILSPDAAHVNTWPLPQGVTLEIQVPVKSSTALTGSPLQALVLMDDGNGDPWLGPTQGVYVFSSQPAIVYPSPSTTNIQTTTAHSEADVFLNGATGFGFFDLGTTDHYGLIHEGTQIPPPGKSGNAWRAYDDWGPSPALMPNTLYHWRFGFTYTPQGGVSTTIYGGDQTFQTLPDGRVTVGNGTAGSCTSAAFDAALATAKNIVFDCGSAPVTINVAHYHSITSNLTIDGGNTVTLQRHDDGLGNHFNVLSGAHLTLTHITLGGAVNYDDCGGSVTVVSGAQLTLNDTRFVNNSSANNEGGAVCNNGSTDITATRFTNNSAPSSHGGAIGTYGPMSVTSSTFTGNSAAINGGAIDSANSNLSVMNSTFTTNTAGFRGGAINTYVASLTLSGSSIVSNTAGLYGGGLANDASTSTVSGSTFSGNVGLTYGGAIEASGVGSLSLTNSTISENSAPSGGGIYWYPGGSDSVTIVNATIAGNLAQTTGANIFTGGVGLHNSAISLKNTIVSAGSPDNCSGTVFTSGNNLEDTNTCGLTAGSDKRNTNPALGPLQNNGGSTATRALLFGSPAIDAGTNVGCPATDQRGTTRPRDGDGNGSAVCDIGAFESLSASPTIANIGPSGGPTAGGQTVTVSGTNLVAASVTIGGLAAVVTGTTATTATFTTPAHAAGAVNVTVTTGFGAATATGGYTYFPLSTPGSFSATATSTTQVALSWSAVAGATGYEVWRSSFNGSYSLVLSAGGTTANDTGLAPDTTYLYKVRAIGMAGTSAFTPIDPATTTIFMDASLVGVPVKAVHITQARTAANAMRAAAGLQPATFTDPTLTPGMTIKRVHVTEIRTALDEARRVLWLSSINYAEPTITLRTVTVKAAQITELRAGTQ